MDSKQDRNTAIVDAVRDGATLGKVGSAHGISAERVRQIAWDFWVRSEHFCPRLEPAQQERIVALFERGMPISHIAEAVSTTVKTVCRHLQIRGLYAPEKRVQMHWTAETDAIIRKHYNSYPGAARDLAERFGTTRNAIIGRANRLGLRRPKP